MHYTRQDLVLEKLKLENLFYKYKLWLNFNIDLPLLDIIGQINFVSFSYLLELYLLF